VTARVLALVGSGETAPTMARVHRRLAALLGGSASGVILDTPYGFQENAEEITARALEYFDRNVGLPMTVAPLRRADEDPLLRATATARLREAGYVFSGPGSPSYALREWRATDVPQILADKLARGGIVTFASAAALTVGAHTVPVYEVYKVGEDPRWLPGLDLLGPLGLPVAVIPHYDNAEGGTHDTRYCYLGEARLARLERDLPEGHFVLGVDSHTALVLDLEAGSAQVLGLGAVTIRAAGRSRALPAGSEVPISDLPVIARQLGEREGEHDGHAVTGRPSIPPADEADGLPPREPVLDAAHALEARFDAAVQTGESDEAVRALLDLEDLLVSWSRDTTGTDEIERARSILRGLIVRAARRAGAGPPVPGLSPAILDLLIEMRARARAGRDFGLSDRIRDALAAEGVELRDGAEGTTWHRAGSGEREKS
jgi:hypothetical protein